MPTQSQPPGEDSSDPSAGSSAISEEEVSALLENRAPEAARPVDFTLLRVNQTQLPMLQIIGKSFAERATAALSGLLSRDARAELASIEAVKAADLEATWPVPGSVAVVRLKPLPGLAYVTVDPALSLALLDGFFGGSGRATAEPQAVIAPAALRFLTLLLRTLSPGLAAAFSPVSPLELELVKQETNPKLLQLGGPHESLTALRLSVEFGAHSGSIRWLIPDAALEPIREALAAEPGKPAAGRPREPWAPALGAGLRDAEIELRALLSQARISLRELVRLSPGDIIPIEHPKVVTLLAGDVPLHRGRFGVSQGRNALKIIPGGSA